jgi:hypothetical protein
MENPGKDTLGRHDTFAGPLLYGTPVMTFLADLRQSQDYIS